VKDSASSSELSGGMNAPDPKASAEVHSHEAMRRALEKELAAHQQTVRIPPPISDHVLIRRIGAGSYGEVWLAKSALGTLRAVKIVYRARFEEAHPYEREFKGILKYEPISRTHEGLVQVLHVGRNDDAGCFYYVMELADAAPESTDESDGNFIRRPASGAAESLHTDYSPRTLRSELKHHQRLAPADAAQLTHRLADALAHLHSHGLVHRDIKPGNVIFVNGQPKLADIGLVAGAGDSRSYVGTEGFVPPEGPGSVPGDIYALGKLLYEIASGHDRLEFPHLPDLPPGSEGEALLELNEIITRAAAPAAAQRYANAEQLRADLQLFLAGRSLRATRKAERQFVFMKRVALAAAACVLIAIGVAGLAKQQEQRAEERAKIESSLRARAEAAEAESRRQLFTALLEQARATVRSGEMGHRERTLEIIRRAGAISNSTELRTEALSALSLPDLVLEQEYPVRDHALARLSPTFRQIAVATNHAAVEIRTVVDRRLVATLPANTNLECHFVQWSADENYLAVKRHPPGADGPFDLEIWNLGNTQRVCLIPQTRHGAVSFHPRKPWAIVGASNDTLVIYDLVLGTPINSIHAPGAPRSLAFSPSGDRVAMNSAKRDGMLISVYDIETSALVASNQFIRPVRFIEWHPAGIGMIVTCDDGTVYLHLPTSSFSRELGRHNTASVEASFRPQKDYVLTSGSRQILCWDFPGLDRAFNAQVESASAYFSNDGERCAMLMPGKLQIFRFKLPLPRYGFDELSSQVRSAAFSDDARWFAASSPGGMHVLDLHHSGPVKHANAGGNAHIRFSPEGELFTAQSDKWRRWTLTPSESTTGTVSLTVRSSFPMRAPSIDFTSNAIVLTGGGQTQFVPFDEAAAWPQDSITTTNGFNVVSPDGRWLAIHQAVQPLVFIYRLPGGNLTAVLTNLPHVEQAQFSPRGDELAVSSVAGVRFWQTDSWQLSRVLTNFIDVFYTTDSSTQWLVHNQRTAALYNAQTLSLLLPLPTDTMLLAVSPDGKRVATRTEGRRLKIWNLSEVREQLRKLGIDWSD
jgi:WD40 repeat protein